MKRSESKASAILMIGVGKQEGQQTDKKWIEFYHRRFNTNF